YRPILIKWLGLEEGTGSTEGACYFLLKTIENILLILYIFYILLASHIICDFSFDMRTRNDEFLEKIPIFALIQMLFDSYNILVVGMKLIYLAASIFIFIYYINILYKIDIIKLIKI
ncbi:hypothetical protein ACJX0J_017340, partial [Zea mays]